MSTLAVDRIYPRHGSTIKIGPVAPPEQDGDVVTKLYVDTSPTHALPTFISPLVYDTTPNTVTIQNASETISGIVSTVAQTFTGAKIFSGAIEAPGFNYEASNGWISGGVITVVPGATTFSVSSVTARFTDYTDESHPVPGPVVTFPAHNNIDIEYPTAIDVGVYIDSSGVVSQDAASFNIPLLYNSRIRLGRLIQPDGTIVDVANSKYPVADRWQNSCLDYFLRTSPLNIDGLHVSAANATDLGIAVSTGTVWEQMANILVNRANPSIISVAPATKPFMVTFWKNNLNAIFLGSATQQLDTTLYNPGGSSAALVPITSQYWVNIPILYNPASQTYAYQYPTEQYSTNDGAILGLGSFIRLTNDLNSFVIIGHVTVQQGATNLVNALFSTGQFFGYGVQMRSTQLSTYVPIINKQSNTVFVDQTIGDDATGSVGNRGRPFRTVNAAIAQITDASNNNPYAVFSAPGKHIDSTIELTPHMVLCGYNQRSNLFEVGSGIVTIDNASWAVETEDALLTLTNIQLIETGFTVDLRAVGMPPFTPDPDEWLSEIEISFCIVDAPLIYKGRTTQDLLKLISSDFETAITVDGGNFLMFNCENDIDQLLTVTASTVSCVSVITGATLGNVLFDGDVAGLTNVANISASHILGSLTVNGSNSTVNINRGSLPSDPANIHLTNGGTIIVYDDLLDANQVAAMDANTVLSASNAVADVALVTNGLASKVPTTRTVNGHALSSNVVVSATDITTGSLPVAQLPSPIPVTCLATDTIGNNTTGSAYALAVSSLLPNATTAFTQTDNSNNTRVATCAYLDRLRGTTGVGSLGGLATLDAVTGKVPDSQINLAGIGALVYKGNFDASAVHDYPTVPPTVNGNFWIISGAGSVSGGTYTGHTYGIGDWMIFNGSDWELIPSETLTIINAWTGSSNIHTVGTVTSGTWNATPIDATFGGVSGLSGIIKGMSTYATVAGSSDLMVPSIDNTITAAWTITGTLLAPSVARTNSSAVVATTSFVQSAANLLQQNILYKSAAGHDDRNGLSINEAVLTFAQAMLNIGTSPAPTSSNQYVVYSQDAAEDGPIALVPYVHLEATAIKLLGTNTIGDYSFLHVKRIDSPGISGVSLHFTGGIDPASVSVVRSYKLVGGSILVDSNQGDVHVNIEEISGITSPAEVIRVGTGSRLFVMSCKISGAIIADGANCLIDLTAVKDISACTFIRTLPSDPTCKIRYPANELGDTTGIIKCDGVGNISAAQAGTDYLDPTYTVSLSGNVTGSGPLNTAITTTIANGAVTLAKMANIPATSVIGNPTTVSAVASTVGMSASIIGGQLALRDTQGSCRFLHATEAFQTAAMANGVYNLTNTDSAIQEWTGSDTTSTEDVIMPDATTVSLGYKYQIINSSLGVITVKNAASATLAILAAGEGTVAICKDTGSSAGQWSITKTNVAHVFTGDVVASGHGIIATTISPNAVSLGKMATLPTACVIGNISGSTGGPFTVPATTTAVASSIVVRDTSANIFVNNGILNVATLTSGSPATLTVSSPANFVISGGTTYTINLPAASSLYAGQGFGFVNNNSGTLTITGVLDVPAGYWADVKLPSTSGSWVYETNKPPVVSLTGMITGSGTTSIASTISAGVVTWGSGGMLATTLASMNVLGNLSASSSSPVEVSAVTSASANTLIVRDATQNAFARHFVEQIDTTAITLAGTTLMSNTFGGSVEFTGTSPQYVYLPDATTLALGIKYTIHNTGTSPLYVLASGALTTAALVTLYGGVIGTFECNSISSALGAWRVSATKRGPPVFDRVYTSFMNSSASNITASSVITTAQLWNGVLRTVNNITLSTPAAATLYSNLTAILGYPPPIGFNFQAYFLSSGNTQTWSAGSGCQFYPTGGITVANGLTGQFVIIIRSPTTYDFVSMR